MDHMEGTVPVFESKIAANAFSGVPNKGEQNQKTKPTPGVTMMHHATKRGFKDCPGLLNSTGRLGPKRGRKCYVTLAFSGVPNKGEQNQKSKPTLRVTMMPLGAPSISKHGSLVRPDAQIVALRLRLPLRIENLRGGGGGAGGGGGIGGGGGEVGAAGDRRGPLPADSRERVATPRVPTTRIGMQEHRLD